jgi:hypothetical protein
LLGAALRVIPEEPMVRLMGVVEVKAPETPVIVTVAVWEAVPPATVNVSTLVVVVGLGENPAVTPLGSPEADSVTLPANPPPGITVIVLVPLFPGRTVRPLGLADSVKLAPDPVADCVLIITISPRQEFSPISVQVTVPGPGEEVSVTVDAPVYAGYPVPTVHPLVQKGGAADPDVQVPVQAVACQM